MKRTKVIVSYYKTRGTRAWKVDCADGVSDHEYCDTKHQAVAAGRKAAKECWSNGAPSQLVIKGKNGRIQTEHTYGRDPVRHKG